MPGSSRREFLRFAGAALVLGALGAPAGVVAEDQQLVRLDRVELLPRAEQYVLSGRYTLQLTEALEKALHRGVTLTFVQHVELDRPRDWWFPEDVIVAQRVLKLSHHALLRQYRLHDGTAHRVYEALPEALAATGDFGDWPVVERKRLLRGNQYRGRVRMLLDITQLPKPLQVNAVASRRWDLDSGWHEWTLRGQ